MNWTALIQAKLLKVKLLIALEAAAGVGLGSLLAQGLPEPKAVADSHVLGIGLLGTAMTIIAFFIKRTLDQVERRLEKLEAKPDLSAQVVRVEGEVKELQQWKTRLTEDTLRENDQRHAELSERIQAEAGRYATLDQRMESMEQRFPFK